MGGKDVFRDLLVTFPIWVCATCLVHYLRTFKNIKQMIIKHFIQTLKMHINCKLDSCLVKWTLLRNTAVFFERRQEFGPQTCFQIWSSKDSFRDWSCGQGWWAVFQSRPQQLDSDSISVLWEGWWDDFIVHYIPWSFWLNRRLEHLSLHWLI